MTARACLACIVCLLLAGCAGIPGGMTPVDGFELNRYLGTWYEIARLDHPFERGLSRVTATYSMMGDGVVKVVNRGYSRRSGSWRQVEGTARPAARPDVGHLKVTFLWPFSASYVVWWLDREHYRYALVCGPTKSYLWILAREPVVPQEILDELVSRAELSGFDTRSLIFVAHD
ncbi:MAG TPA: lipocalin family protein [Deltaproteobacteria bacterium]|nr:lipocalin family protein [Deltaproteobacteria bacterium]